MSYYLKQNDNAALGAKLYYVAGFVLFVFLLVVVRLWYLQVTKHDFFDKLADNNRIRLVKISAPRGIIFDRNGIPLAENRPGFDLIAIREDLKDIDKLEEFLPGIMDITKTGIEESLVRGRFTPSYQPVKLKEDLEWKEVAVIESSKMDMPGIDLKVSPKRVYPYKTVASHLIGYISEIGERQLKEDRAAHYAIGDTVGSYGIEASMEKYLRGIDGGKQIEVDALGREITSLKKINPTPGSNVYLTVDLHTQHVAEELLKDRAGAVVAIDPGNGKIIAMVSSPSFDPNIFVGGLSKKEWDEISNNRFHILINKVIQGQYPPASTFKVITAAALLEDGIVSPHMEIFAGPSFEFAEREYRDWKAKGHGSIDIYKAIVESSDTFFYKTGLMLGIDRLSSYAKGFGLGKKTGINLTGEKPGLVPSKEWKLDLYHEPWYQGETISASVGQGFILVTPLQMVNAYSAIANGGTLYQPRIVDKIVSSSGDVIWRSMPKELGRLPVSGKTLSILRSALKGVVNDKNGTARNIRVKGVDIAGKTGTAQLTRLGEKRKRSEEVSYKLRDHAWFVGYAPADNPKIAVAVLIEHGGFGSRAAAPIAGEIIKAYLGIDNNEKRVNMVASRK